MNNPNLHPDDLPCLDNRFYELSWELEEVAGERFYANCDPITQNLLTECGWDITITNKGLNLIVICPNHELNWEILQSIPLISDSLKTLSNSAQIRIYPPPGTGSPMEVMMESSFL
jgi:hypothetical protein